MHELNIYYFTEAPINQGCQKIRLIFRVLGIYNFELAIGVSAGLDNIVHGAKHTVMQLSDRFDILFCNMSST